MTLKKNKKASGLLRARQAGSLIFQNRNLTRASCQVPKESVSSRSSYSAAISCLTAAEEIHINAAADAVFQNWMTFSQ